MTSRRPATGFVTAQRILAVAAGLTMMVLIGGWGQLKQPAGPEQPAAARAVRAITSGSADTGRLPADYATVMGYQPIVLRHGGTAELTRADGSCSSPFGGTPYHFTAACRQHDLGYDLLRYANRKGQPLGPWARRAIDAHFVQQTEGRCHQLGCRLMAGLYTGTVRFNSWRQGYGAPVFEPLSRLLVPVGGGLVTAVLLALVPLSRPRYPLRWLAAAGMLALTLQPGGLPHPGWLQALIGALAAAQGYGLAALIGGLGSRFAGSRLAGSRLAGSRFADSRFAVLRRAPGFSLTTMRASVPPALRIAAPLLAGAALITMSVIAAHPEQLRIATAAHLPAASATSEGLAATEALLLATVLVHLVRGLRDQAVRRPQRAVAIAAVPALFLAGWFSASPAQAQGQAQRPEQARGQGQTSPGPASELMASKIQTLIDHRTRPPIRIYVHRTAATTTAQRAGLAVTELEQAGGFDRAVVLVDLPTGSGWVNPQAIDALERLTGGDLATVTLQYAHSPSWLAYLRGGEGAQASARALIDAVRARIDARPADHRPRLLVYGESLGAWAGLRAYPNGGIADRVNGALWVGVPGGLPPGARTGHQVVLNHPDDPVPSWSPSLIVRPPAERPGGHRHWLPFVTFWQSTADVISAERTPSGFGHRYGAELLDSWKLAGGNRVQLRPETSKPTPSWAVAVQ
jgi:hypothetical protein